MIVEICANSFESSKAAREGGADRIELCTDLSVGGLTPSHGLIEKTVTEQNIPVHVLIRPRSGNFSYSEAEIDVMQKDIAFCKKIGCAGIVSGSLTVENTIDIEATKYLIDASKGMEFTFHRAFDWCIDPLQGIDTLIHLGVTRLLSSGQRSKAIDGIELLKKLKSRSKGQLEIMPGSGINEENVLRFKEAGFTSVHLSATKKRQMLLQKPAISMHSPSFFEEGVVAASDKETIRKIITLLS